MYAKEGETITIATSAQGLSGSTAKRIFLFDPENNEIDLDLVGKGHIPNRTAELAGPERAGLTGNDRYVPATYTVPAGGAGVYRVQLYGTRESGQPSYTILADDDWTQPNNLPVILAWDISVVNATNDDFVSGRVYTTVLNLSNGNLKTNPNLLPEDHGFHGLVYVKTKDGYTYRVDNNGNNGIWFTFFVNNNGFVNASTQLPIYKSLNKSTGISNQVHNPNNNDAGTHITHKLFYDMPNGDLPVSAAATVTSNSGTSWQASSTWLNVPPITPDVTEPQLIGVDGKVGQISNKGGYIHFDALIQGNFRIEISSDNTPPDFETRVLTGQAQGGTNTILWDGLDGIGAPLPNGEFPAKVSVQLQGAEVHFPFIDMEYNQYGTIIELIDGPEGPTAPNRFDVYWDDTDIPNTTEGSNPDPKNNSHLPPVNSVGINSTVNGHIWGIGATGTSNNQFGDAKSIDTWAFIVGEKKESESMFNVKIADLYVGSITSDKTDVGPGDVVTYTVVAGNTAGSQYSDMEGAPFVFILPPGFVGDPSSITLTTSCGAESVAATYDPATRSFTSVLDLPRGCEITYTFSATATEDAEGGGNDVVAAIMRPNDVTDPDATNISNSENPLATPGDPIDIDAYYYPPTDPLFEVEYNGFGGVSNNIAHYNQNVITDHEISLVKTATYIKSSSNTTSYTAVGDKIEYVFTIANEGNVNLRNVVLTDVLNGVDLSSGIVWTESITANDILEVGETWTATVEYTITQSDVDAGSVSNQGVVTSNAPNGDVVEDDSGTATNNDDPTVTPLTQNPNMSVVKTETSSGPYALGDEITYSIVVSNHGNVTISGVEVTDDFATVVSGDLSIGTLSPGQIVTIVVKHAVTQDDIDNGSFTNTALVEGKKPNGDDIDDTDSETNTFTQTPNMIVTKTANPTTYSGIGDVITYIITVKNTGNVSLINVTVSDPLTGLNETIVKLIPDAQQVFTTTYTIVADDLSGAEQVVNTVNTSGKDPNNNDVTSSDNVTVTFQANIIDAVNDVASTNRGYEGVVGIINVFDNDEINSVIINPSDVILSLNTADSENALTLNSDGTVDVAPNTPAGTYTLTYQICEVVNPANCDIATVTITVTAGDILAIDDNYTGLNGYDGGTTASVLANDEFNGQPINPSDVTLTAGTSPHSGIVMNADGTISVAPGTPAGTYNYPYTICENLNSTNCDNATATIILEPKEIIANNDSYTVVNGYDGGTTASVLTNDLLGGNPINPSDITLTPSTSPHSGIIMNGDGTITVAPGTPAGEYTYTYTICENLNPTNCDNAVVTINVGAAVIDAVEDNFGPIVGHQGGTTASVLTNDLLNGQPVNPSEVTLTPGTSPHSGITMGADGTITVASGTPEGTYYYPYTICENLNPTNCDNATATIVVSAAVIDAVEDNFGPIVGHQGETTASVLVNDLLNGQPVDSSDVTLTPGVSPHSGITMNGDGTITVASGTPEGTYYYPYTICENLNPTNCDNAVVTIVVSAAVIDAVEDNFGPIVGHQGGTTASVLANDLLNGQPFNPSDVTLTPGISPHSGITMNGDGTITVAPGTPANEYTYTYEICEVINPSNCDNTTVTIVVSAAKIDAIDDTYTGINGYEGGTTASVLDNDLLNGNPLNPSDVTLTPGVSPHSGITMNGDGTITVAPGTPADEYTYTYTICENLNPTNCDEAVVTINVGAAVIDAVDDSYGPIIGHEGGTTASVLTNDELNGQPLDPNEVTLAPGVSPQGGITMNEDGTITVAPGTPEGSYTYEYTICENLNPTNCDDAEVTIVISAAEIVANNDDFGPIVGHEGGTTISVLTNDLLNGNPVDIDDVILTPGVSPHDGITMNDDGTITIAPGTPEGDYTYTYVICEEINPTNCDNATVIIHVDAADIDAIDDVFPTLSEFVGGTTASVLDNDELNGQPVDPNDVTLTPGVSPQTGITMNPDGTITVAPGTTPGTYQYNYTICENLNPTNCDNATAYIEISAATIIANNDTYTGINGHDGGTTASVLDNDILHGDEVDLDDVILTPGTSPHDGITMNDDGTITIAPGTPGGTYDMTYEICEEADPTNCDNAVVTIVVGKHSDLSIEKTVSNATPNVGDDVTFTLTLSNAGPNDDTNIEVTDMLPSGYTYVSHSGAGSYDPITGIWEVATIAANTNEAIDIVVTVNASGDYENIATITDNDNLDPETDNNTDTSTPDVNTPPVIDEVEVTTNINTPIEICVPFVDAENNGDFTATVGCESNGTISDLVVNDGEVCFTYTPDDNYIGTETLCLEVCDGANACSTENIEITVVNTPPLIEEVEVTTNINTPIDICVEFTDAENNGPFTGDVDCGGWGETSNIVINQEDGTICFTYTPTENFISKDTLCVTVCDGANACTTVDVEITVVNTPPVIEEVEVTTNINTPIDICVEFADAENNGDFTATIGCESNGTITNLVVNDGEVCFTYTPDENYTGLETLCLEVCDGANACTTVDVEIIVINTPPVVEEIEVTTEVNTPIEICVEFTDAENNGPFTATVGCEEDGTITNVVISEGKVCFTYTPDENFTGDDTLCVTVCDGVDACATVDLIVTVGNNPPVVDVVEVSTEINTSIEICVPYTDAEGNGPFTATVGCDDNGTISDVVVNNGEVCFTYTPDVDFIGVDTLCITVCDGANACTTADVIVDVYNPNTPPVINDSEANTIVNRPIDICVPYTDAENNGPFTATVECAENGTVSNVFVDEINGTICFTYTPNNGFVGTDVLCVTICDGANACSDANVVVNVEFIELTTPTGFSPDGDGINDYFVIDGLEQYDNVGFKVFNRWGNLVFKSENYDNAWDGRSNVGATIGDVLPEGTYFYLIKVEGVEVRNGFIVLKR